MNKSQEQIIVIILFAVVGLFCGFVLGSWNANHQDLINEIHNSTALINQNIAANAGGVTAQISTINNQVTEINTKVATIDQRTVGIAQNTTTIYSAFHNQQTNIIIYTFAIVFGVALSLTAFDKLVGIKLANKEAATVGYFLFGIILGAAIILIILSAMN